MEINVVRRSPALIVIAAAFAYVIASALRDQIPVESNASMLVRSLDVSLLYVVILLPGVIVGWLLRRHVLVYGFLAGILGDTMRQAITAWLQWATLDAAPGGAALGPDLWSVVTLMVTAIPAGVIGAAGGGVGYVLATGSKVTSVR
jgi:hypothetical protein